jgi:hypothetical protein
LEAALKNGRMPDTQTAETRSMKPAFCSTIEQHTIKTLNFQDERQEYGNKTS